MKVGHSGRGGQNGASYTHVRSPEKVKIKVTLQKHIFLKRGMPKDKHLLKKVIVFVCPCITLVSQETWPRKSRSFGEQRGEEEELASSSSQSKDFSKRRSLLSFPGIWDREKDFFCGGKRGEEGNRFCFNGFSFPRWYSHFFTLFLAIRVFQVCVCIFNAFL